MNNQRLVVVPFTPYEWKTVRSMLLSTKEKEIEECLGILAMWNRRMGDSTPVAVSCSHVLLSAIHADIQSKAMADSWKHMTIDDSKAKHGHAIVRFTNYVNEMGQVTSGLMSMATSVSRFGIPGWVVENRHAVAHASMPDLAELQKTTRFCLEWLWSEFWDKDACTAMNSEQAGLASKDICNTKQQKEQEILKHLKAYKAWREQNGKYVLNMLDTNVHQLIMVRQHLLEDHVTFLQMFVSDGILISRKGFPNNSAANDSTVVIPHAIETYWEPILVMIFDQKLASDMALALLCRLKSSKIPDKSKWQIIAWSKHIIHLFIQADKFLPSESLKILDTLLSVATHFDKDVVESVLSVCPLKRKRRAQVRGILDIATSTTAPKTSAKSIDTPTAVRTVSDLRSLIKKDQKESTKVAIEEKSDSLFAIADVDEWVNVPFGLTPGQRTDTFTLVMDRETRKRKNNE